MSGIFLYVDDKRIFIDFSDNFGIHYILQFNGERKGIVMYSQTTKSRYVVIIKMVDLYEECVVKIYMSLEEFIQLRKKLNNVKLPAEFLTVIREIISCDEDRLCCKFLDKLEHELVNEVKYVG